jgi:hypothetical protein
MFNVNQTVGCVNASPGFATGEIVPLILGAKYVIDGIHPSLEVVHISGCKLWFHVVRFRPIVARATDISCFIALLNPSPQKWRETIGYDLGFTKEEIGAA